MAKQILFKNTRQSIKAGVDAVADAVKITIGPRGRNVALDKGYGSPTITNDGVSIAREISLKDKFENMGAEIAKEVAGKTNDIAGDGTSTSLVLLQAIVEEGVKSIEVGHSAMGIRAGIEEATKIAVQSLKDQAKPIATDDEIKQIATISAESEELGATIAETIGKVGKDGVVTVEESNTFGITSEVVDGMEIAKGYISPYMITDTNRMESELKDPMVLVTDKKISVVADILPLLEKVAGAGKKDLLIIAEEVDGEALGMFVVNKLRGSFNVLAVRAPGYGDNKKDMLQDIATVVGATVISDDVGLNFKDATLSLLGDAARVVSTKDTTKIIGGKGGAEDIKKRVDQLKAMSESSDDKYQQEKLAERIAKISGGVAIIRVGASTETEMKYLKLKIEDAVNATKAAIDEGIVAGGGSALIGARSAVKSYFDSCSKSVGPIVGMTAEQVIGFKIIMKALEAPLRNIAINAGKGDGSSVVDKVVEMDAVSPGYDAKNDVFIENMIEAGIIDPVKVTRSALQFASSSAGILLTTEVAIAELPADKEENK